MGPGASNPASLKLRAACRKDRHAFFSLLFLPRAPRRSRCRAVGCRGQPPRSSRYAARKRRGLRVAGLCKDLADVGRGSVDVVGGGDGQREEGGREGPGCGNGEKRRRWWPGPRMLPGPPEPDIERANARIALFRGSNLDGEDHEASRPDELVAGALLGEARKSERRALLVALVASWSAARVDGRHERCIDREPSGGPLATTATRRSSFREPPLVRLRSRRSAWVTTRAPASRQTRAAARSSGHPRLRSNPDRRHTAL